jgi:hypothetical protein
MEVPASEGTSTASQDAAGRPSLHAAGRPSLHAVGRASLSGRPAAQPPPR